MASDLGPTVRRCGLLAVAMGGLLSATTGCLNPNLANSITGGVLPTAPGDLPFVLVRVVNRSSAVIESTQVVADTGLPDLDTFGFAGIDAGVGDWGIVFACPVLQIGLGDVEEARSTAMVVTFPGGATVQVPNTGLTVQAGVDFNCGDTILYIVSDAPGSPFGVRIDVGRIDGSTQTGPFSRADTFETVYLLLALNGLLGGTTPAIP